ncbi:unnamed protein product [Spirodela intermedia]|uniref:Uncharacterized protein n=1 Tax=Spirodela intermedia TaxID=51605 RepID=A0A7I8JQB6_SPIIN|nr:unnamed protein product [Spirodela intermedia]CAA6671951.1 unnamed protein product [Spirodela intermedia]
MSTQFGYPQEESICVLNYSTLKSQLCCFIFIHYGIICHEYNQ